jgi:hypothetical protein
MDAIWTFPVLFSYRATLLSGFCLMDNAAEIEANPRAKHTVQRTG